LVDRRSVGAAPQRHVGPFRHWTAQFANGTNSALGGPGKGTWLRRGALSAPLRHELKQARPTVLYSPQLIRAASPRWFGRWG